MKMKPRVKASGLTMNSSGIDGCNHNSTLAIGLRVQTAVKAGRITANHNETLASGVRIRTVVKAGCITANQTHALADRATVQE